MGPGAGGMRRVVLDGAAVVPYFVHEGRAVPAAFVHNRVAAVQVVRIGEAWALAENSELTPQTPAMLASRNTT